MRPTAQYAAELPQSLLAGSAVLAAAVALDIAASGSSFHSITPWLRAFAPAAAAVLVAALFFLWRRSSSQVRESAAWRAALPGTAIIQIDATGRMLTWPVAAEALFGYTQKEASGSAYSLLFAEQDRERRAAEHQLRLARGNGQTEDRGWKRRKDGTVFWAGISLRRCGEGYLLVVQDLSELKAAEDLAADQTALLDAVLDGTFDVITVRGLDSRYRMVNAAAAHLLGVSRREALGKSDIDLLAPDDAVRSFETDRIVAETGQARVYAESVQIRGEERNLLTHKTPWRDHQGNIVGVLSISAEYGEAAARRHGAPRSEICAA